MLEAVVKDRVKQIHKRLDVFGYWPVQGMMGRHGISDHIGCVEGRFVATEAKRDGREKLTKWQQDFLDGVGRARGTSFVVHADNLDWYEEELKRLIVLKGFAG